MNIDMLPYTLLCYLFLSLNFPLCFSPQLHYSFTVVIVYYNGRHNYNRKQKIMTNVTQKNDKSPAYRNVLHAGLCIINH